MTLLLVFLVSLNGAAEKSRFGNPVILDGACDPAALDFIYFSSSVGVYVFDRETRTWSRINQANGLPGNQVEAMGLDEGILWVATTAGLASADVRLNDWQVQDWGGRVSSLAFDDQYVWAAGEFGLKRFDKYSETWQDLIRRPVRDLARDRDYIWIASDSGVLRYDQRFERIEEVAAAPARAYDDIVNTPDRVWFFGAGRMLAFRKTDEVWSEYGGFPLDGVAALNDTLFAASRGRISYYEPKIDDWVEFRGIEGLGRVSNIAVNQENLLAATDAGLAVYSWTGRQWKSYNTGNGMVRDTIRAAYQQGGLTFALSDRDIEFQDPQTGIWQALEYRPSGGRRQRVVFRDEAGSHLLVHPDLDVRLQGRAYLSYFGRRLDSLDRSGTVSLNLIGQHKSNRLFSLYYDDSDKSDTVYGGSYRGRGRDLLHRLDAGYLKSDYFGTGLIPQYYHRGGSMMMRRGPVSLDLQAGQLKSTVRNDFFTGRTVGKKVRIMDRSYLKNVFYYDDSIPKPWPGGADTVFVDDRIASNNTAGTRIGFTIAGLAGDFDPLLSGRDYFIDRQRGLIHFLAPRADGDRIVLSLNGRAYVLQTETRPGQTAENIYFLGPDIIPSSFALAIRDTAGIEHPLSDFGLDRDRDGRVDPDCVNYDLGLLLFPDPHPFPDTVHRYTIDAVFESYSYFYFLTERPVLIGSERVYVDGELKTSGADYVVDYSSGIVLFLRPDIASDFSEIQVQYSLRQRGRADWFYSAQPVAVIGSGVKVNPGYTRLEGRDLYSGSVELTTVSQDADFSLRLTPEVVLDAEDGWAQNHRLVGRCRTLSFNSSYQGYSPGFNGLGLEAGRYGRLSDRIELNASLEPLPSLRLEGDLKEESRIDTTEGRRSSRFLNGKASYLGPRGPGGYLALGRNELPDYDNNIVMAGANWAAARAQTRIKLNAQVRSDDRHWAAGGEESDFGYLVNTNLSLPASVRFDGYYQRDDIDRQDDRDQRDQDLHGVVNFDLVPGVYCLANYTLKTRASFQAGAQELSLLSNQYNNFNLAPGRWYPPLSLVNFALGTGSSCDEYLEGLDAGYRPPLVILGPIGSYGISHASAASTYYGACQVTPGAAVNLWLRRTLSRSGLAYYGRPERSDYTMDEAKLEYEPRGLGYFLLYGFHRFEPGLPAETADNLYGEWNRSWNLFLRTKLTADYGARRYDYRPALTAGREAKASVETIFRFWSGSLVSLRFGGRRQREVDGSAEVSMLPGLGMNLSLGGFLYVQFNWDAAIPLDGAASHAGTLKVTGQF